MDRRRFLLTGAAGVVALAASCGGDEASPSAPAAVATPAGPVPGFEDPRRWAGRTLRVGAWGGEVQAALRTAVWQPFAAATGCTIEEVETDYARLDESIRAAQTLADLVLVDPFWAESAAGQAATQPLGLAGLAPEAAATFGGNEAGVPAFAYALVGAYRRDGVPDVGPPASWQEWWDVERYPGPRALARDAFGTFEFALLADGVEPDALYPLDGARAIEALKEISGRIVERWWDSGSEPVHWLGSARADLASSWHYRVIAGQRDGLGVDFDWSQGLIVADRWVVPVGAREPDVAVDLVRYAMAAETQAALARAVPLGPVNPSAFRFLDGATAARAPTAPSNLERLLRPDVAWWVANRGDAMQRFNGWLLGTPGNR